MSKIILVMSMSLDGFIAAGNRSPEEPLGGGGDKLHEWILDTADPRNQEILTQGIASIGAVIAGRNTYDSSLKGWKADGPTGSARLPVCVVSHSTPKEIPENGVYSFADSVESAATHAKATAGDKDVSVMGGADIGQQFIRAGYVDEIQVQLIPVLLTNGIRLFDHLGSKQIQLETLEVVQTPQATHIRYRIIK